MGLRRAPHGVGLSATQPNTLQGSTEGDRRALQGSAEGNRRAFLRVCARRFTAASERGEKRSRTPDSAAALTDQHTGTRDPGTRDPGSRVPGVLVESSGSTDAKHPPPPQSDTAPAAAAARQETPEPEGLPEGLPVEGAQPQAAAIPTTQEAGLDKSSSSLQDFRAAPSPQSDLLAAGPRDTPAAAARQGEAPGEDHRPPQRAPSPPPPEDEDWPDLTPVDTAEQQGWDAPNDAHAELTAAAAFDGWDEHDAGYEHDADWYAGDRGWGAGDQHTAPYDSDSSSLDGESAWEAEPTGQAAAAGEGAAAGWVVDAPSPAPMPTIAGDTGIALDTLENHIYEAQAGALSCDCRKTACQTKSCACYRAGKKCTDLCGCTRRDTGCGKVPTVSSMNAYRNRGKGYIDCQRSRNPPKALKDFLMKEGTRCVACKNLPSAL